MRLGQRVGWFDAVARTVSRSIGPLRESLRARARLRRAGGPGRLREPVRGRRRQERVEDAPRRDRRRHRLRLGRGLSGGPLVELRREVHRRSRRFARLHGPRRRLLRRVGQERRAVRDDARRVEVPRRRRASTPTPRSRTPSRARRSPAPTWWRASSSPSARRDSRHRHQKLPERTSPAFVRVTDAATRGCAPVGPAVNHRTSAPPVAAAPVTKAAVARFAS